VAVVAFAALVASRRLPRQRLDLDRFRTELTGHHYASRIERDVASADRSGVAGTPTFFINGRRHDGAQDLATLSQVIGEARAQVLALS
jgi:protein-disulfide isomerase